MEVDLRSVPQCMRNPVTGEFEMMTTRQWWLIKLGLDRDLKIDDWTFNIIRGPEFAVGYGFNAWELHHPGGNRWLVKQYELWFKTRPNSAKFANWCYFMYDVYDIPKIIMLQDEAHKLKIDILRNTIDTLKISKKIKEKMDAHGARKMAKAYR